MTFMLLILSVLCISSPVSSALSPETLIQTPAGFVEIQYLKEGDTVVGIDLHTQQQVQTKIREVRRYLVASRTKITTDQTTFIVSDDQLMRVERAPPNRAQIVDTDPEDHFVAAHNVCVGDRLQTYDGNVQVITPYSHAYSKDSAQNSLAHRSRTLLLSRKQIDQIAGAIFAQRPHCGGS